MIFDFNIPYSIYSSPNTDSETYDLCTSVGGIDGVGFGRRIALAAAHLAHIPGSILNIITKIVHTIFIAIGCAFSLGELRLLNKEVQLALVSVVASTFKIGIHTAGLFAPVNAFRWNTIVDERFNQAFRFL